MTMPCQTIDVPAPPTECYKGVIINMTPCPWSWGTGNFWVDTVSVGGAFHYYNCYPTLIEAKAAIDTLATYTFNQC